MAEDLKMVWDNDLGEGDFSFMDNDLERDTTLITAVYISIYTDKRARPDEGDQVDDVDDLRGWWGDQVSEIDDEIGSKLWLLARSKTTNQVEEKVKQYILDALAWMIEDEICIDIKVTTERYGHDRLYTLVELYKLDGQSEAVKFDDLWEGL